MRDITLETKIADLLNNYPNMKEILIAINPKFKKLNNPILRRTIGKVAGVKQAAIVGGMDPMVLLNQLREAVGQSSLCESCTEPSAECLLPDEEKVPEWVAQSPKAKLNANTILDEDKNPLAVVRKALKGMATDEILVIEADFRPEPLIDAFAKEGHVLFSHETEEGLFLTYLKKS